MDERETSVLNCFDFSAIEEMDPSLAEGHRQTYDRNVPFELRIQDISSGAQEVGTLESIRVKILVLGDSMSPANLRIELVSENDLFFHYVHSIDEGGFRSMQDRQKLMIDYSEYSAVLTRMLDSCVKEPSAFLAVFIMHRDGHAHLDFIQNIEYKFVELLSIDFLASSEEIVRQQITYRYGAAKSRLGLLQARLQDVNGAMKVRSPSLLMQINKGGAAFIKQVDGNS